MPEAFDLASTTWWRFTRYEIRDGYIRPAPTAKLETYDPWEEYRAARLTPSKELSQLVPYWNFIALFSRMKMEPDSAGRPVLPPKSEAAVIDWCERYGLLGLLLQQVEKVVLAPRRVDARKVGFELRPEAPGAVRIPFQTRYYRRGATWFSESECFGFRSEWQEPSRSCEPDSEWQEPGRSWEPDEEMIKSLLPHSPVLSETDYAPHFTGPYVDIQEDVTSLYMRRENLGDRWRLFFPDVDPSESETHYYPLPLSERFWRAYAEPVASFVFCADQLARVLELAGNENRPNSTLPPDRQMQDTTTLNALVAGIRPVALLEGKELRQRWSSPSLYASLGMMMLQDITERRILYTCVKCGQPFLSTARQPRYCGVTCRNAVQKQVQRQRRKQADKSNSMPNASAGTKS